MTPAKPVPFLYGGWSATARFMTLATGRPVSRQLVRSWWVARDRNGFPDLVTVCGPEGTTRVLVLEDVLVWYLGMQQPPG